MNATKWQEREDAIVRSIMSGNNACGTLARAAAEGGATLEEFLRAMVRATLQVCAAEDAQKDRDIAAMSRDIGAKRFALESAVQNLAIPEGPIREAFRMALPGHPLLGGYRSGIGGGGGGANGVGSGAYIRGGGGGGGVGGYSGLGQA